MSEVISIGMFGMGNVGTGIVRLLAKHRTSIENRIGTPVRMTKAVVSNPAKDRGVDVSDIRISADPGHILNDPDIDIVLELVGGLDAAETIILEALKKGKSVVTANKALLAEKGRRIFKAAHDAVGCFGFETSVGTAIPVIRALREGFAGDEIHSISGILNGTSNYILSRMSREGMDFDATLKTAQEIGLAEADPTLDVQGIDAAHKLIILMNIAFNGSFEFNQLYTEGITQITAADIRYTDQLGYTIKHMGKVKKTQAGTEARVHPALIPKDHILSSVNGAFNCISVAGEFMGPAMLHGLGAGPGPSAVGVMGDVIEAGRYILSGRQRPISPFSIPLEKWRPMEMVPMGRIRSEYYLRFPVMDRLGVLASISKILAENRISVKSVIQKGDPSDTGAAVDIVIITHEAVEADVQDALNKINEEAYILGRTRLIRIESE